MLFAFRPGTNRVIAYEGGRRPQTGHLVVVFADRACGGRGARSGDRAQQEWGLRNSFVKTGRADASTLASFESRSTIHVPRFTIPALVLRLPVL